MIDYLKLSKTDRGNNLSDLSFKSADFEHVEGGCVTAFTYCDYCKKESAVFVNL